MNPLEQKLPGKEKKAKTISWKTLIKRRKEVLHQYQPPQYSQEDLMKKLINLIQAPNGYLDQMYAYVDLQSGMDWLNIATHALYSNFVGEGFPMQWVAQMAKAQLKKMGLSSPRFLEVIALGSGDGYTECKIVETLLEIIPSLQGIPFYLLDINTLLLDHARKHAKVVFQDEPRVCTISVPGNMYEVNLYKEVFFTKEQQALPRVILFLGGTFGNIDDEIRFLQHSLGSFAPGTLLVMDYLLRFAPSDQPAEIFEKEPYFAKGFTAKWIKAMERFYLGPIQRYKQGKIKKLEFRFALEPHRAQVTGSYHIELYADVILSNGQKQSFGVQRIRRYDSEILLQAIEASGWQTVAGKHFASNREVYLFCKQ